jgi:non-heme chloroperoxidase
MPFVTVGQENSGPISIYYEDHGAGRPVVLVHGWPLSGASWERQVVALLGAGYRVITYDRRGFGASSRPATGFDYDTLVADLNTLMTELDLRDAALIGFSMGGGEVARYVGTYGVDRLASVVFMSAVPPFLLHTDDNPEGAPPELFSGLQAQIAADRPGWLSHLFQDFYNADVFGGTRISDAAMQLSWNIATAGSAIGTWELVNSFSHTDFRDDLATVTVPTLVIHGDADRIVPFEISGRRTHEMIPGSRLEVIGGAPHGMGWTHADEVNKVLLDFLAE